MVVRLVASGSCRNDATTRVRPEFDQCVQPQAEIPAGDIAPHVANLLLPGSEDFLHVVKSLFDGGADGPTKFSPT